MDGKTEENVFIVICALIYKWYVEMTLKPKQLSPKKEIKCIFEEKLYFFIMKIGFPNYHRNIVRS